MFPLDANGNFVMHVREYDRIVKEMFNDSNIIYEKQL
jgi:hypothetical protein